MAPERYHFVLSSGPNSNKDRRSIELEASEIRSHAAKISHGIKARRHALGITESNFTAGTLQSLLRFEDDGSCHPNNPDAKKTSGGRSRSRKFKPKWPKGSLTGTQFPWHYRDCRPGPKTSGAGSRANTNLEAKQSPRSHFIAWAGQTNCSAPALSPAFITAVSPEPSPRRSLVTKQYEIAVKNQFTADDIKDVVEAENLCTDLVGMTPVVHDHLDPFLQLAGSSSRDERNLVHYCNVQRQQF